MVRVRRLALLLSMSASACEPEPTATRPSVQLRFEPDRLELGVVPVGFELARDLSLSLEGGRSLRILDEEGTDEDARLVDRGDGFSLPGRRLKPRSALDLRLLFTPVRAGLIDRRIRVVGDTGDASLRVRGQAVRVGANALRFEPASLDFGQAFVGERRRQELRVSNTAAVAARFVRSDGEPSLELEPEDFVLSPGGAITVWLAWAPTRPGPIPAPAWTVNEDLAVEAVTSGSAIAAGRLACDQELTLGPAARGQVRTATAACWSDGPVEVGRVRLDGSPAFRIGTRRDDEAGVALGIAFAPTGLAGVQTGRVSVESVEGQRASIELRATTLAPEDPTLRVEASWDRSSTDLDLHLTRRGAPPFTGGEDCHFQAKNPDWGEAEDWVDDPFLDRDALEGPGAEVINLQVPAESVFDVWIHAFGFAGDAFEATTASVAIALDGRLVEADGALASCGTMWWVGTARRDGLLWSWAPTGGRSDFSAFADERCR